MTSVDNTRPEVPDQGLSAIPGATPTERAAAARRAFTPIAVELAAAVCGEVRKFAPEGRPLTALAEWFVDPTAEVLIVVVGAHEERDVADAVLAYALAWQQDADLVLILPATHLGLTLDRLPWIGTPVRVFTYGRDHGPVPTIVPSRAEVLRAAAGRPLRTTQVHDLKDRAAWVQPILDAPWGLVESHRPSYLAWHCAGRQVLRIARAGHGLTIEAGVAYKVAPPGEERALVLPIRGPLTVAERAQIDARIERATRKRVTGVDGGHLEHRLQAALAKTGLKELGLDKVAREYPAWRGDGRPGFIDFLAIDHAHRLHVVETKVGTADVVGVLQTLDYRTWVSAHSAEIRDERNWPTGPSDEDVIVDFVLAPKGSGLAIGPYFAGQVEAIAGDVMWTVSIVENPAAEVVAMTRPLRRAVPPSGPQAAVAVQPPRWAKRVATALASTARS